MSSPTAGRHRTLHQAQQLPPPTLKNIHGGGLGIKGCGHDCRTHGGAFTSQELRLPYSSFLKMNLESRLATTVFVYDQHRDLPILR